ncbi:hypothetical protein [Pseudomonas sp. YuFO8]|jgi:hypothetical protein|uniref:hypothetical protein n=1 Tax=Pseudomonas sp. YuFO8 TaxID=3095361 RepID=UPI000FBF15BD|nr:hypothetical protein [Pseudomonas sp. YuFO8]MEB2626281.1 hypothetical protein [Pseudomonas sp. YuFO8]
MFALRSHWTLLAGLLTVPTLALAQDVAAGGRPACRRRGPERAYRAIGTVGGGG